MDYYKWVIEGDLETAEKYLQSFSPEVRFMCSKEEDKYAKGNKVLSNGLVVRGCQFSHQLKTKKNSSLHNNTLPIDSRHTLWEGGEVI